MIKTHPLTIGFVVALGFAVTTSSNAEDVIEVWVGILPQVEMVERIGGEHVAAHSLVQPGDSPTTYEPTPKQLAALWQADLYLAIGVPFEEPLLRKLEAMNLNIPIASVFEDIDRLPMDDHHGHGDTGSPDPHIWLDPELVKVQAAAIRNQLCEIEPAHCVDFDRNLEDYLHDVDAVERRMDDILRPYSGRQLFVFHPSFGYLARRYGLQQVAVEVDGKQPSPANWPSWWSGFTGPTRGPSLSSPRSPIARRSRWRRHPAVNSWSSIRWRRITWPTSSGWRSSSLRRTETDPWRHQ